MIVWHLKHYTILTTTPPSPHLHPIQSLQRVKRGGIQVFWPTRCPHIVKANQAVSSNDPGEINKYVNVYFLLNLKVASIKIFSF